MLAEIYRQVTENAAVLKRLEGKLNELLTHQATAEFLLRATLRALQVAHEEVNGRPRLFTLVPADRRDWRPGMITYRLTLWCQQPGAQHPWPEATYEFRRAEGWLTRIAPYVLLVSRLLHIVFPIGAAAVKVALEELKLDPKEFDPKIVQARLELMGELVKKLPLDPPQAHVDPNATVDAMTATGPEMRALREVLDDVDPGHYYGGLRAMFSPSADFVWVCPIHHRNYDPDILDRSA
jgi:internalin A